MTEYCIFCGKPIPESDYRLVSVVHRYCSTRCAQREQNAVRKLRDSTPPEPEPEVERGGLTP